MLTDQSQLDWKALLDAARSGDVGAQDRLFTALREYLTPLAKRTISNGDDVRDVVQETEITIFEKYRRLPATTDFLPWCTQVLRHKVGNYLKHQQRQEALFIQEPAALWQIEDGPGRRPDLAYDGEELKGLIRRFAVTLAGEDRRLLQCLVEGLPRTAIHRWFPHLILRTLSVRVHRVRQSLLGYLRDRGYINWSRARDSQRKRRPIPRNG